MFNLGHAILEKRAVKTKVFSCMQIMLNMKQQEIMLTRMEFLCSIQAWIYHVRIPLYRNHLFYIIHPSRSHVTNISPPKGFPLNFPCHLIHAISSYIYPSNKNPLMNLEFLQYSSTFFFPPLLGWNW